MHAITAPTRRLLVAACTSAALTLGIAQAQTTQPATVQSGATVPAAPQLSIRDIYDRMEAAGYRDMREIEFDKGRYEVKARNTHGERVKLYVNASTGAVERERKHD